MAAIFKNIIFIKEIQSVFFSEFIFKCNFCNTEEVITSENRVPASNPVNSAMVASIVNTGQWFSQLVALSVFLRYADYELPILSKNSKQLN